MQYVRKFDVDSLHQSRFDYQVLADLETCLVVACRAPAGQAGPARHVHGWNQVYYVLDGEMKLELGDASHVAGRDSLVFISEGTPHHNWNAGDKPELHLDILVPPPARGNALSRPALETEQAPATAYVRHLADQPYATTHVPGFDMAKMASPETGSGHITVNSARLSSESPGTSWHIHPFDQLYFVLEGVLTIDVADEHHEVRQAIWSCCPPASRTGTETTAMLRSDTWLSSCRHRRANRSTSRSRGRLACRPDARRSDSGMRARGLTGHDFIGNIPPDSYYATSNPGIHALAIRPAYQAKRLPAWPYSWPYTGAAERGCTRASPL